MSDEKSPEEKPSTPTPVGNQNLIIGLVLGAVILLLFILVVQMTGGTKGMGTSSEVEDLKADLAATRSRVNAERSRLGLPPLGSA